MLYQIRLDKIKRAQIESWNGIVIKATPAFWWAIGKEIDRVIWWLDDRYITWTVVADGPRFPSLGTPPADSEIAKKTSP
jgi:hypothetical protein